MKKKLKNAHKSKRHRIDDAEQPIDAASTSSRTEKSYSENDADQSSDNGQNVEVDEQPGSAPMALEHECWTKTTNLEEKSREEEFDEYLADLLL